MKSTKIIIISLITIFSLSFIYGNNYDDFSRLLDYDLIKGDESGDLALDSKITRAEVAVIMSRLDSGLSDTQIVNLGYEPSFSDVSKDDWFFYYVGYAESKGLVEGFNKYEFKPYENIRYVDMLILMTRVLGYDLEGLEYPNGYILKAEEIGFNIREDVKALEHIRRRTVFQIMEEALDIRVKN